MNKIEYTARKLNSLKQTLIKSFEAINSTSNDPKYYYETIWDLMNQKSNIKEMFVKATLSKQIYLINISSILRKIQNYVIANFVVTEYNKNRKVWLSEDKPY